MGRQLNIHEPDPMKTSTYEVWLVVPWFIFILLSVVISVLNFFIKNVRNWIVLRLSGLMFEEVFTGSHIEQTDITQRPCRVILRVSRISCWGRSTCTIKDSHKRWMCPRWDTNPRPSDYMSVALTTELHGHIQPKCVSLYVLLHDVRFFALVQGLAGHDTTVTESPITQWHIRVTEGE